MEGHGLRRRLLYALFCCILFTGGAAQAEETTVRLRLAWGSGGESIQRWSGQIEIVGGELTDMQPLGIEADESAALRLEANRIVVAPLVKRRFDGCDIAVRTDSQATLRVELRSEQTTVPRVIEFPVEQILSGQVREPLDDFGSFLLAHRSPGDHLRVTLARESLVFDPGEILNLRLQPDLTSLVDKPSVQISLTLRATGEEEILWETQQLTATSSTDELEFQIACPAEENAYRISIEAYSEEGFAGRLVPGRQGEKVAHREVEFVVIDPNAKLPPLVERWLPMLSIDPANPSWWQRLPHWAQVSRLSGKPVGAVGNVRPLVRPDPAGDLVELPPTQAGSEPSWQAYPLSVKEPHRPHLVEIRIPPGLEQSFSVSVIEPDAAGRVVSPSADAAMIVNSTQEAASGNSGVHRVIFWPRSQSPLLLLTNQHSSAPAQYGTITLFQHDDAAAAQEADPVSVDSQRLVAGYISQPVFHANFGAPEVFDPQSGMSLQGWSTFLSGAKRFAQYLRLCGYNGALVCVAADGSAIYPSKIMNSSPRYDTAMLSASGQDPTRKDVLEMLLRIFDREGLRLVPTLQLAAPLPRLESLRAESLAAISGIAPVDHSGESWLSKNSPTAGLAPYYNPLNAQVQSELSQLVVELQDRCLAHRSFAGLGIQLSGTGYGVLPGLAWALDDQTTAQFSRETGIAVPQQGDDRFLRRAEGLSGVHRSAWQAWRTEKLTQFYANLADQLVANREDLQLIVATEDLFSGPQQQQRLRESLANSVQLDQVLLDHGIDLGQLDQQPGLTVLSPYRFGSSDRLSDQALDLRINAASQQNELAHGNPSEGTLIFHRAKRIRLGSFDQRSPFGAGQTHLSLAASPLSGGAAARSPLVGALASSDTNVVVFGGAQQPLGQHHQLRRVLKTLQQLPNAQTHAQTQTQQPLVMRIYRSADSTTVLLINQSQWPLEVRLPLEADQACTWKKLGDAAIPDVVKPDFGNPLLSEGTLQNGSQTWQIVLQPYDLQAWTFAAQRLRVEGPEVTVDPIARSQLQKRIDAIESRTGNLNIQRPYHQLQNPGFELVDVGDRIVGWQPRIGSAGTVEVALGDAHSGERSLRCRSTDDIGVVVQSHLFPMPETGQLVVSAFLRSNSISQDARMHVIVEDSENGRHYQQVATLEGKDLNDQWSRIEFPVEDIPLEPNGQMRIQFHFSGQAEVLIDDIELHDLRFDNKRRVALVKRIYAAKTALDEGQWVDCLRLVDDYWSRYLVQYVPPQETKPASLAKQPNPPAENEPEESPALSERLRGWVPKMWR